MSINLLIIFTFKELRRGTVSFQTGIFSLLLPVGVVEHAVSDLWRFLKLYADSKLNLNALLDTFVVQLVGVNVNSTGKHKISCGTRS